jgi:hypothetical protein
MKIIWISDPHFDFLHRHLLDKFLSSVAAHRPGALLITGDISNAAGLEKHLTVLATSFSCPIYFLLGNHDFYGGSFAGVDRIASRLCLTYPNLVHLGYGETIVLDAETVLIGHRGWADGRAGLGRGSSIRLNDQQLITDFAGLDSEELFDLLEKLGDESADYVREVAPRALAQARNLIIATHVPPFAESPLYAGKPSAPNYAPHFCNVALGQTLLDVAATSPSTAITVLCGHTHHAACYQARPNLTVRVAHAEYKEPSIAGIITLPGNIFAPPKPRDSYVYDRFAGVRDRMDQRSALRALAHEARFSPDQPPSLLKPGIGYETDTPFARIEVANGVHVPDAQNLFAVLAEQVNVLAKLGKITLIVGAKAPKGGRRAFQADPATKTLSFFRDGRGRLRVMVQPDPADHILEGLRQLFTEEEKGDGSSA